MSNLRYIGLIPPWEIHFFKRIQGFHQAKPPSLFFVFWGVFWWNLLDLAPGLHLRTYFSSFSKRLRRSARHMTWLLQPTELTAESKPLHLAVSVESSHQTAHKIIALGAQIPDWDLLFFFYFFFLGGEHMPHQLCSTFPPDDHSHPTGGVLSLPGLERREGFFERLKYSTGNYRKVRSHVKLVFTSACSAQRAQAAFKMRRGCLGVFFRGDSCVGSK